jgi:hypothetical protein
MSKEEKIQSRPAFTHEHRRPSGWLSRLGLTLLVAVISQSGIETVAAQNKLTKLDPESLVVPLENGQGTSEVTFALAPGCLPMPAGAQTFACCEPRTSRS